METTVPKTSTVFATLFKADMATQMVNRRSAVISLFVPLVILFTWKGLIKFVGGPSVLSNALSIGLIAIGLMGYTLSVARDRDKGIFQRLRVAPVPTWIIMTSRICIQLLMIMLLTLVVFIIGYQHDEIALSAKGYCFTFLVAILGGAVYLSLGQFLVGLIKNFETLNATTRISYAAFIMLGTAGELMVKNQQVREILRFSPYGSVKMMLMAAMEPAKWSHDTNIALLVSFAYIIVFAGIGIKKFKWNTK